jgi:hypothetical protein
VPSDEPRHLGFTGTRRGMTTEQIEAVTKLVGAWDVVHHGDCLGADAQCHTIARSAAKRIIVHPPSDDRLRAHCAGDVICPPKPYFARNRDIVNESDLLIATPAEFVPKGGTWYTLNYARSVGKPTILIYPSGLMESTKAVDRA